MTWSGACTQTCPSGSKPGRPARPASWWNSRTVKRRTRVPSNFVSAVISTVRIGMLTPTPSVSVPQITGSRPCAGEPLDEPAVAGQHPGVVHADAVADEPVERVAEAAAHPHVGHRRGDRLALRRGS